MTEQRLAIIGAGRMGTAIAGLAAEFGFEPVVIATAELRRAGLTRPLLGGAEVAVEFTSAAAAAGNIRGCLAAGCAVVSGTTGWDDDRKVVEDEIRKAGGALLWAPNFAIGVHLFMQVVAAAARRFRVAGDFDAHITDVHHAAKKDAPSGTARLLQQIASEGLGRVVPVTSIRTGHAPGTHTLAFDAPFEQVRIEHLARDRRVFAAGALRAARWIAGRRGVFTLDDMLGSEEKPG